MDSALKRIFFLRPGVCSVSFVFVLLCLTYYRTSQLEFQMEWDDYWVVINRYTSAGLHLDNLKSILTDFYRGQYSPINELYYILIYSKFGYDPLYFHLLGLLIHFLNCLLIYQFLFKISRYAFCLDEKKSLLVALISASLFAIHPMNEEAVLWISASKVLLYAFFYLIALNLYVSYLCHRKTVYFFFSCFFFLIAFGAKEQAVTFPLALIALDFAFNRKFNFRVFVAEKVPILLISTALGVLTVKSQDNWNSEIIDNYNLKERFFLFFYTLDLYFTQSVLPLKLSYLYPMPFQPGEKIPFWQYIYPPVTLCILYFFTSLVKFRVFVFGMLFFFIHLVFVLNIVSLSRYSVIADRYTYISMIGIVLFLSYGFIRLIELRAKGFRILVLSVGLIYFSSLSVYTFNHLSVWTNSESLKREMRENIRNRRDFEYLRAKYEHSED